MFKKILKVLLFTLLGLLALIIVIAAGLFGWHFVSQESAAAYIPDEVAAYLQVDSVRELYEGVIDLKATELVLTQGDMGPVFQTFLDFKANKLYDDPIFKEVLNTQAHIALLPDYTPVITLDLGIKSIGTRLFPLLTNFIKIEGFNYSIINEGTRTYYGIDLGEEQSLYFALKNNLVLISMTKEGIRTMFEASGSGANIANDPSINQLKNKVPSDQLLTVYISTQELLQSLVTDNPMAERLFSEFTFDAKSVVALSITNNDLSLYANTKTITNGEALKNFLSYKSEIAQVTRVLPETTNIYTSVNFKSFTELYTIFMAYQDDETQTMINDLNGQAKNLLGFGVEEMLFNWAGSEMGVFTIETAPEPIVFIEIENKQAFEEAMTKIDDSIFLDTSDSLVIDDVRVSQIELPGILAGIASLFAGDIETPYFIEHEDFFFMSMNPEALTSIVTNGANDKLLYKDKNYQIITSRVPKNANLFAYYDLNSAVPYFLAGDSMILNLIRLYEKGFITLYYTDTEIKLNISVLAAESDRTTLFPGFPRQRNGFAGDIILKDTQGSLLPEVLYMNKNGEFVIEDIAGREISNMQLNRDAYIVPGEEQFTYIFNSDGAIYKFNGEGSIVDSFPISTELRPTFPPVFHNNLFHFFDRETSRFYRMTSKGDIFATSIETRRDVLTSPGFSEDSMYYYPKNLFGEIFAVDKNDDPLPNWPQRGGGISFCAPIVHSEFDRDYVIFLTQKGDLSVWDTDGSEVMKTKLDGVFYADPVIIKNPEGFGFRILVINKTGRLSLIDYTGEMINSRALDDASGEDTKLAIYDVDNDSHPEIFVYGSRSYIYALDSELRVLPAFPVNGSGKPYFVDINSDGNTEMIIPSFDDNLYGYTIRK